MNTLLAQRGLPVEAERQLKARPYVLQGGPNARAGFQLRWELLHQQHVNKNHSAQRRKITGLKEAILYGPLPTITAALRDKTTRAIVVELSGQAIQGELPTWAKPHLEAALLSLKWPNQDKGTLQDLLKVVQRVIHKERRSQRQTGGQDGDQTLVEVNQDGLPSSA
jgi:hypothetical protein